MTPASTAGQSRSSSGPGFAGRIPPQGPALGVPAGSPGRTPAGRTSEARRWARNPIDRFLLAAMERHGLAPAPEADRRTLIRRLTFDLTGCPPTPAEVAAFLADTGPEAYERLVDRLLASPHYGERWARHWLDLARFAETAGHEFDYDIAERVPLSRLRDPRLERRSPLRPVRDRAGCRRPAELAPAASGRRIQ